MFAYSLPIFSTNVQGLREQRLRVQFSAEAPGPSRRHQINISCLNACPFTLPRFHAAENKSLRVPFPSFSGFFPGLLIDTININKSSAHHITTLFISSSNITSLRSLAGGWLGQGESHTSSLGVGGKTPSGRSAPPRATCQASRTWACNPAASAAYYSSCERGRSRPFWKQCGGGAEEL